MRVANDIPLGSALLLPVGTVNPVQTLKAVSRFLPHPFYVLVAGRFVVGLAVGIASMAIPLYIAELAPSKLRGTLVAVNVAFITGGQFISCVVAATLSDVWYPHGWQLMLGLAAVPALIQLIGLSFVPESPRWLMKYVVCSSPSPSPC
jgi:SP family myo-inositol transporter-like MFS transporter 13